MCEPRPLPQPSPRVLGEGKKRRVGSAHHGHQRRWAEPTLLAVVALFLLVGQSALADNPHFIVDNFSSPLPDAPAMKFSVDTANPKVGLGTLKADYEVTLAEKNIEITIPDEHWLIPAPGKLVFWLKGDGSGNELQFVMYTGKFRLEPDGRRSAIDVRGVDLPRVKLDSKDWKEITLDVPNQIPEGNAAWVARMRILGNFPDDKSATRPTRFDGSISLDDMRLYPDVAAAPQAAVATALLGPAIRDFTSDIAMALDARNFTPNSAKIKVRLSMTDRNQNTVADRDFNLVIDGNQSKEFKLDLAPENIGVYLPPFHVTGDVMSTDLPALAARVDANIVMANSRILVDNLSNVNGNWLTRGYRNLPGPERPISQDMRSWNYWIMGEACRAVPWVQTATKINRVLLDRPSGANATHFPPDKFAMKFDYSGESIAFTGFDRYLPGNAFQFGIWVKGDGSNSRLMANFLDFSDLSDFWYGGWKRVENGDRVICRLDFTDWRYFTVPLPGNGIGTNTIRGSTEGIDFPIELTDLVILPEPLADKPDPARPAPVQSGTVLIGPMFADTQQTAATTLAAMIGYDDPKMEYAPQLGATVSIQNAWRTGRRKIEADWTLADRDNQPIVTGKQIVEIPGGEIRNLRIELASEAAKIATRPGPLRLQVVASDQSDFATNVTREIALAKPDAIVPLADFEADRGYLGSKLEDVKDAPEPGEPAAHTSAAQHHSGQRSLEILWDKEKHPTKFVAIDPPIPGVSIEATMWVKGDGSGALFYPIIGGPKGVRHGLGTRTWNLFIPRVEGGALQDAVRLDFTDWRQFTFTFPPVPSTFDKTSPVLHFLPTYPQGLHLAVDARGATGNSGAVYVDDVTIRTHLSPDSRLALSLRRDSESDVVRPDSHITFVASNYDAAATHHAQVTGGVFDWRGSRIAPVEAALDLKPAENKEIAIEQKLPPGAYELRVQMKEGEHVAASVTQDLLVADLAPVLGPEWPVALKDEWKLRVPIKDKFTYLDEDWDWIEHYPGNIQTTTMHNRFAPVQANGADPWMLLGFSALWSSGTGYEQMKAGAFNRIHRHSGQGVDIFLVPQRDEDWETYVIEVMRGVGKNISGWVMWDNPDGTSSLALSPKRLASLIRIADKWRRVYCPNTPMIIGGMARSTAIPYLGQLAKEEVLPQINGVNVRMDVGRMSPEDSQVLQYARALRESLAAGGPDANIVLLTELDWAVEKTSAGLNVFDQAAYLVRSDLLLSQVGIKPALSVRNGDYERLGTGLAYRSELDIPPMSEQTLTFNLKPAWWAMVRTRELLSQLKAMDPIPVQDVVPERTRATLFARNSDGKGVAILWRNDNPGAVSFSHTGLNVESAEDIFGAPVAAQDGWYSIGKMPVIFNLAAPAMDAAGGLRLLWVRDVAEPAWPQRVIAEFAPDSGQKVGYSQTGGIAAPFAGRTPTGNMEKTQGLAFGNGSLEKFAVDVPTGSGLILRKRYFLDKTGQSAVVIVNGKSAGAWNLKRSEAALSEGVREGLFVVEAALLSGQPKAEIEIRYDGPANTIGWTVLEYQRGDFPLSALGPVHADQQVGPIRIGRNMVGGPLKVDTDSFANGIGAYANSLLEYPLNGQFSRFTAKVGIDAATEGRGSVIFEAWGDGKKIFSSGIMSGLDRAKPVDINVSGINRLRLIVNDAGDGNKYDAGDWCEPVLKR